MTDVPHYFLYGETVPSDALDSIYIAALEESLPKHNWEIRPHRHDNLHQLLVIEDGQALINIREHSSEEKGHCILSIPPREVHGFVHHPGVRGFIVTIVESFLQGVFAESELKQFPFLFNESLLVRLDPESRASLDFEMIMRRIVWEYRNSRPGQIAVIGAYLKILFILLARSANLMQPVEHQYDAKIKLYDQFQSLLEAHYFEHWSVRDYAEAIGLTGGRLNRLCQRFTGQSALQIIHGRLITEAKRKLIYMDMAMNEVAYDLGFKDPAYFSRFFSKHCGEPPGKYKLRIRNKNST